MSATEGSRYHEDGSATFIYTITLKRHLKDYENIRQDIIEALGKYGITLTEDSGAAATEFTDARATAKPGPTTRKRTGKTGRKRASKSRKK